MIKISPLVIALGFCFITYIEGCGRTPAKPAPPPTTTPSNVNTTLPVNHRLVCTENETNQIACLNGGSCFAVYVEYRTTHCACPAKYIGDRCQMIDPTIIFGRENEEKVTKAGLAAGLTALILFLTVLIFILIWHRRYVRRKEREKQKEQESKKLINGDLNNGNYKPAPNSKYRDSYSEKIPLAPLPLNQTENSEIPQDEEESTSQKFSFSNEDIERLTDKPKNETKPLQIILQYIKYADDDQCTNGAAPTNV